MLVVYISMMPSVVVEGKGVPLLAGILGIAENTLRR
jgi:hypothetical protein